ncbi:MAG: autotransporter outer membrane beta-barrel domain-containing protein, partial [Rhizobiales bacterium]|nr:autotransporter outer membrane beta-barrel domain-containing protein [Hyphomicrobiales bacterium]MBN8921088.1 autotransporter outer membrane beta-barrel domain-containing protein [Hyphomicrobiales bacterium]
IDPATNALSAVVPVSTTRVGTFGQVGFGVSGQILQTGFVGFVRGDVRFGERLEGGAFVTGARYSFSAQ